jgi:hypothetical protein
MSLFDLTPYTDEGAVSLASARRLLANVEWLDEPGDYDGEVWWPRHRAARALAVKLGASDVVVALDELGNPDGTNGLEQLGIVAVRAARDFLRSKEAGV